eukprot:2681974-Pyramimonas_sp.AAC.1
MGSARCVIVGPPKSSPRALVTRTDNIVLPWPIPRCKLRRVGSGQYTVCCQRVSVVKGGWPLS